MHQLNAVSLQGIKRGAVANYFFAADGFKNGFRFCHIGFFFLKRDAGACVVRIAVVGKFVSGGGNLFYFVRVFFGNNAGHKKSGFNVLARQHVKAAL